jgi:hypothetical protein
MTDKNAFSSFSEENGITPDAIAADDFSEIMAKLPKIYYSGKGGFAIEHEGAFIPLPSESQVRQHLSMAGVDKNIMTQILCEIRMKNYVSYIGPVAGIKSGLHFAPDSNLNFLVTVPPKIIQGVAGEWPFIRRFFDEFVGTGEQRDAVISWIRQARRNVISGERRPLPAAIFVGPPNCGKTFILDLIRQCLGGRSAAAFKALTGRSEFNGDIIGSELLVVDDEIAHSDFKARTSFAQSIKRDLYAGTFRVRRLYSEALVLRPVHALAIAVNNEAQNLQVLPTLDNDTRAKLSFFACSAAELDGLTNRKEIKRRIESELPAFVHYLDSTEHPKKLQNDRTQVAAWHSLEVLESLGAISAEERFRELLQQCTIIQDAIKYSGGWRGTAAELEGELMIQTSIARVASKILFWDGACGNHLGKLQRSGRAEISSTTVNGRTRWTIRSLIPPKGKEAGVVSQDNDSTDYYVKGWSGGGGFQPYMKKGYKKGCGKRSEGRDTSPPPPPAKTLAELGLVGEWCDEDFDPDFQKTRQWAGEDDPELCFALN